MRAVTTISARAAGRTAEAAARTLIGIAVAVTGAAAGGHVSIGGGVDRWSWDGDDVTEIGTTATLGLELSPKVSLDAVTGFSDVSTDVGAGISGLTDTQLRLTAVPRPGAMLRIGLNGPTGQSEFDGEDLGAILYLTDRLMSMPTRAIGRGLDVDLSAAYAVQLGSAALGGGVGYLLRGALTPFANGAEYDPGDRLSLAIGVDLGSHAWLVRQNLRVAIFTEDVYDGDPLVESGNRIEFDVKGIRREVGRDLWAAVSYRDFGEAEARSDSLDDASFNVGSQGDFRLSVGADLTLSPIWRLDVSTGLRFLSENALGSDGGRRFDVAAHASRRLRPDLLVSFGAGIGAAAIDDASSTLGFAEDTSLTGLRVSARLRRDF